MVANMVCSLLDHEVVNTTLPKARVVRRTAENMITFAKRGDLHARRQVLRLIPNKRVVAKLFEELGPRYEARNGGYTRIVKSEPRRGDGASMCIVELVDRPGATGAAAPAEKPAAAAEEAAAESGETKEDEKN